MYVYDAKSDGVEESEQKFDESIGGRVKSRKQKAEDKTDEVDNDDESEQKFDESIGGRVKSRKQKAEDKTNEVDNDDEQSGTTDMPDLESLESAAQRRKQKGQGLKS